MTKKSGEKSLCPLCGQIARIENGKVQCLNTDCQWHQNVEELVALHSGYLRTLFATIAASIASLAGLFTFINILNIVSSQWRTLSIRIYGAIVLFGIWFLLTFFVSFGFVLYKQVVLIERSLSWSDFIEKLFVTSNEDSLVLNRIVWLVTNILRNKKNLDRLFLVVLFGLASILVVSELFILIA